MRMVRTKHHLEILLLLVLGNTRHHNHGSVEDRDERSHEGQWPRDTASGVV